MRRSVWTAGMLVWLAIGLFGCGPSQEDLDREQARVRELQGQLRESEERRQALEQRIAELTGQTEQISGQLAEAESGRQSLRASLEETQRALEELRARERQAQARLATFRSMLERFRAMIESGQLRVRIVRNRMVVELPAGILFESGRDSLRDEGEATLTQVAQVLATITDRQFQVSGHTDNVPIRSSRFPSNWELSTSRAVNVTRFLIEQGVPAASLSAAGYADTQPSESNDTEEGRQANRRIEIALVPNLDELPDLSSLTQ